MAEAIRTAIAVRRSGSGVPAPAPRSAWRSSPGDGEDFETLLRCADQRLLRLKSRRQPLLAARAGASTPAPDLTAALPANQTHSHYARARCSSPSSSPSSSAACSRSCSSRCPPGLLGTWIVLRGLAFFSHAVGTAAFPGLVLADGLGFAAPLGAFAAAAVFAPATRRLGGGAGRRPRQPRRARPRRLPRRRGDPRQRRLRLRRQRRDAALRQPAAGRRRRHRARRRRRRGDAARQPRCSAAAGSRSGFDPDAAARAGRRGAALDAALLGLIALAVDGGAHGGRRAAGRRAVRRPGRHRAAADARGCRAGSSPASPWSRSRARVGLWLSVETDAPAGGDDRLRRRRGLRARRARPRAARRGVPRAGRRWPRRPRARSRCSPPAAAAGRRPTTAGSRSSRRRPRSATGRATVGGDAVSVHQILQPNTDPHEYEPRPSDVEAAAGADARLRQRRRPRRLDRRGRRRQRQRRRGRRPRRRGARPPARRGERRGGVQVRPALVARPAQRRGRGAARSSAALAAADPAQRRRLSRATPPPTSPAAARSTPASPRCIAAVPPRAAQARHRPRRLRLLRPPLRDRGGRRGDPVADDPGAALGQGPGELRATIAARARQRGLPGELAQPEARRGDRRARPAPRPTTRSTATRSGPEGSPRRDLPRDGGGERRRDGARLHRREACAVPGRGR